MTYDAEQISLVERAMSGSSSLSPPSLTDVGDAQAINGGITSFRVVRADDARSTMIGGE
ncbi:MAG: hypothetical protein Q8K28_19660 [Hoeflea sp.]|uniref:hypothetical protein n=1 Tax=Hoeflea sp. TaxID=1940281 RepID=UPI002730FA7A|nr:hypothetical protein [Hoeflea sp.]MDP2122123.1 hypothetical protein [Hoeflea sp.]